MKSQSFARKNRYLIAIFAILAMFSALSWHSSAKGPALGTPAATAQGRTIGSLIGRRDATGLFALFTADMARAVPLASLRSLLDQTITTAAPLGNRVAEIVLYPNGGPATYTAQYAQAQGQELMITATFAADRKISSLLLQPAAALPERSAFEASGKDVSLAIAHGDATRIFARFSPEMAQGVPLTVIRDLLETTITPQMPLGSVQQEAVFSKDKTAEYVAVFANVHGRALVITIDFARTSAGKIIGMRIQPAPANAQTGLPADPRASYRIKTALRLPFAPGDRWFVFWGGDTQEQNYHVIARDQRHAFDFVARIDGTTHRGDGSKCEQYYDWGRQIVAPAAAIVIEAIDGQPDNAPQKQTDIRHPAGNHVLLDFGNGEYALLAHMQRGSLRVHAGDRVKAGQSLGLCGNSGNTSEPHLHFHVQDKPYLFRDATGLPILFRDYVSDGARKSAGSPEQGETVVGS